METEKELERRVKPLAYKVKAMSRELPSQKADHFLLDMDLQNYWSTGTNNNEWILLELEEPCLFSNVGIYNKSVLEWEISVGYKPDTFVKVRSCCEAPGGDMMYAMNYTACRYVRISCMRGNTIALFFYTLIGIPVPGLEPEFHPVVNHLLLLNVTSRLGRFLPHLETDLNSFSEAAEPTMRFLAMLSGPLYPFLHIVSERETAQLAFDISDYEASKTSLMVCSNIEPASQNTSSAFPSILGHLVFRPDKIFILLRKASNDSNVGNVCKMASRILMKLRGPITILEVSSLATSFVADESSKNLSCDRIVLPDYSNLFGEEFQIPDDVWDPAYLNVLDSAAVEEGIMHVLYALASQPLHCSKLAENTSDFWLGCFYPLSRARAALKYIILALSGNMDDTMARYKEVKHQVLFLLEMLEPFLDPSLTQGMIPFGDMPSIFNENQEHDGALALAVIRTALRKSDALLARLEVEWRRGSVAPRKQYHSAETVIVKEKEVNDSLRDNANWVSISNVMYIWFLEEAKCFEVFDEMPK
ncbi:hypothetical protein CASFOL_041189 [Castilleja foliolosa]|uniref:Uncharacterized protein n=1 Tax=Castilleja foliolosa TaxID=1961234 RepID=A0ABD3BE88_9LAMI